MAQRLWARGFLLGKALKEILILGGNLSEADDRSRRMI